ncbi:hypothetical protein PFISCL1PPCAC_17763, partial [Pristionchus fissidentatus]
LREAEAHVYGSGRSAIDVNFAAPIRFVFCPCFSFPFLCGVSLCGPFSVLRRRSGNGILFDLSGQRLTRFRRVTASIVLLKDGVRATDPTIKEGKEELLEDTLVPHNAPLHGNSVPSGK